MADTLLGPHAELSCPVCKSHFDVVIADSLSDELFCPFCRHPIRGINRQNVVPGDLALMVPFAGSGPQLARWQLVVVKLWDGRLAIKRLVGLPGEKLSISGGDIYINGRLMRKPPEVQPSVVQPIFPIHLQSRLWQPEPSSRWKCLPDRFVLEAKNIAAEQHLVFRPFLKTGGTNRSVGNHFVLTNRRVSNLGQIHPAEVVHPVVDVVATFRIKRLSGSGQLAFVVGSDTRRLVFRWLPTEQQLEIGGNAGVQARLKYECLPGQEIGVWISTVDRNLTLTCSANNTVRFSQAIAADMPWLDKIHDLRFLATQVTVELANVYLYRDVYYLPDKPNGQEDFVLRKDEIFLLGDNPLCSEDSRRWHATNPVRLRNVVGRPVLAISYTGIHWGLLRIVLPDLFSVRLYRSLPTYKLPDWAVSKRMFSQAQAVNYN